MSFEMTVGLFVNDQEKYAQYRVEIAPLLNAEGGRFRYDFEVARTLKSEADHDINRVFVIQFPDVPARSVSSRTPGTWRSMPESSTKRCRGRRSSRSTPANGGEPTSPTKVDRQVS